MHLKLFRADSTTVAASLISLWALLWSWVASVSSFHHHLVRLSLESMWFCLVLVSLSGNSLLYDRYMPMIEYDSCRCFGIPAQHSRLRISLRVIPLFLPGTWCLWVYSWYIEANDQLTFAITSLHLCGMHHAALARHSIHCRIACWVCRSGIQRVGVHSVDWTAGEYARGRSRLGRRAVLIRSRACEIAIGCIGIWSGCVNVNCECVEGSWGALQRMYTVLHWGWVCRCKEERVHESSTLNSCLGWKSPYSFGLMRGCLFTISTRMYDSIVRTRLPIYHIIYDSPRDSIIARGIWQILAYIYMSISALLPVCFGTSLPREEQRDGGYYLVRYYYYYYYWAYSLFTRAGIQGFFQGTWYSSTWANEKETITDDRGRPMRAGELLNSTPLHSNIHSTE